eukprot:8283097-Pyramimonas_sp.AAC.1
MQSVHSATLVVPHTHIHLGVPHAPRAESDAGSAGIFSRRTNRTQEVRVYSHDGPSRRGKCGYILTTDQTDAGSAGIFSRRTNRTHLGQNE